MTKAARHLMETFETLPFDDRRAVVVKILRRTTTESNPPLEDAELALAADQVFLDLDRREEQG